MFGLLDDEEEASSHKEKEEQQQQDEKDQAGMQASSQSESADSSAWTDVSSTKSRRLAPQWASTKPEPPAPTPTEVPKKKDMIEHVDVVSEDCLEPALMQPIDPDEVIKIWNAASETIRAQKDPRGRARGRGRYDEEKLDDNIWDDCSPEANKGGMLDLADFSAATFKFCSESGVKNSQHGVDLYDQESDDMMAQLLQEQNKSTISISSSNNNKSMLLQQTLGLGGSKQSSTFDSQPQHSGGIRVMSSQDQMYQLDTAKVQSMDGKGSDDNFLESLIEEDMDSFNINSSQIAIESLENDTMTLSSLNNTSGRQDFAQDNLQSHLNADSFMSSVNVSMPPLPIPPPEPEPEVMIDAWYYKDPQQNLQGPFDTASMRRWLESGYFKEFLPIKLKHWSTFYALGVAYPNPKLAFLRPIPEPFVVPQSQQHQQYPSQSVSNSTQQQQSVNLQAMDSTQQPQSANRNEFSGQQLLRQQVAQEQVTQQHASQQHASQQRQPQLPQSEQRDQSIQPEQQQSKASKSVGGHVAVQKEDPKSQVDPVVEKKSDKQRASDNKPKEIKKEDMKKKDKSQKKKIQEGGNSPTPTPAPTPAWGQTDASEKKTLAEIQSEEEKRATDDNSGENNSKLLKSLLGVGVSGSGGKGWGVTAKTVPSSSSLRDIQQEQKVITNQQQAALLLKQQNEAKLRAQHGSGDVDLSFSSSQWKSPDPVSGTQSSNSSKSKSLVDIMHEEASLMTSTGDGSGVSRTSTNSWASRTSNPNAPVQSKRNIAAPTSSQAKPQQPSVVQPTASTSSTPLPNNQREIVAGLAKNKDTKPVPSSKKVAAKPSTTTPVASTNVKKTGDSLTDWGVEQLKHLNTKNKSSTDDLALIQFCLILESSIEIREYLAEYLGSTPEVSLFASEFIRRKEGKPASTSYASSMSSSSTSSAVDRNNSAAFGVAGKKKNKKNK